MRSEINIGSGNSDVNITKKGNTKISIKIGSTIIVLAIVLVLGMRFINSPKRQIVGNWKSESGFTYVFQSNGNYSHDGGWFGTYSVDGNTLTLCPPLNNPEIYEIDISSKKLILYKDGEVYRELNKF